MHKIAVFAAGLTCLFLPVAEAVPITSGFAEITATDPINGFGSAQFSVTGPGFSFTGGGEVGGLGPVFCIRPMRTWDHRDRDAGISSEDRGLSAPLRSGAKHSTTPRFRG